MDRKHHQLQRGWKIWKWYTTIPPSSLHSSPKHNSFLLSGQISSKELVWIGTLLGSNHKTFSQPPFCKVSFPHCVRHGRYWLIIALLFNYFCPKIYNRFGWTWWQSHPPKVIVQWENPPSKWSNISESSELDHMVPTVFFSRLLVDVSIIYAKPAFIDRFHERVTSSLMILMITGIMGGAPWGSWYIWCL